MRFKVDENLHPEASAFLVEQGHDALSVWDQNLRGVNVTESEVRVRGGEEGKGTEALSHGLGRP